MKKNHFALYARTSTARQHTENQILVLKQFAESRNIEFDLYEEKLTTRKTRPVKQHLLELLRSGKYTGVIVSSLDRWARSSLELLSEIESLTSKGIEFISIRERLDFNSATGKLHLAILSAFASFEKNLLSERTKMGLARVRASGKILGRPKGSRDKKQRKKAGYFLREARKKQFHESSKGRYHPIEDYLNHTK